MKKIIPITIATVAMALTSAQADFTWFNTPDAFGNVGGNVKDENGDPLIGDHADPAVGYFVQLLFDQNANGAEAPGVDPVVDAVWVGQGSNNGGFQNGWLVGSTFETWDDSPGGAGELFNDGDQFYVRFWNRPSPSFNLGMPAASIEPTGAGVFYGNSVLLVNNHTDSLTGGKGTGQQFDVSGTQTLTAAIPEPSSFALLGLGAIALFARARKKK